MLEYSRAYLCPSVSVEVRLEQRSPTVTAHSGYIVRHSPLQVDGRTMRLTMWLIGVGAAGAPHPADDLAHPRHADPRYDAFPSIGDRPRPCAPPRQDAQARCPIAAAVREHRQGHIESLFAVSRTSTWPLERLTITAFPIAIASVIEVTPAS